MRTHWDPALFFLIALLPAACSKSEPGAVEPTTTRGLVPLDAPTADAEPPGAVSGHEGHGHEGHGHGALPGQARPYYHDFGAVPDGEVAQHVFRLRNSDPVPVTISRMSPSCGCTVPFVSYTNADGVVVQGDATNEPEILTVPPGALVELGVVIDSVRIREKNVHKLMQVRVTTTSEADPFLTLECSILVEQPFRALNTDLRRMPVSVGGKTTAQVLPVGSSGARIAALGAVPDGLVASLVQEEGRDAWRVEVEALPPIPLGIFQREIELQSETKDGMPGRPFLLRISGGGIADVELRPPQVILREGGDDGGKEALVTLAANVPGMRLLVLSAEPGGSARDSIRVEFEPVEPDSAGRSSQWNLRVRALPDAVDKRFSGTVVVRTDDPQHPELSLTYASY